ncbi:hypothetical protein MHPYR_120037 [uncultured Mycobacterium sp.]|uniref:Uncharacterized protein n=1 Tax=uncultured Mycobacterium sp. TaxID=171292 RepID=A0A1Y5NZ79_9MYCO|nr:hypothetical protein MHPYR_120037 [uncultured Mycobacterium sp.]
MMDGCSALMCCCLPGVQSGALTAISIASHLNLRDRRRRICGEVCVTVHTQIAPDNRLASRYEGPLCFGSVMSASVKPRLAGRQPSNRGGVLRVKTRLSSGT